MAADGFAPGFGQHPHLSGMYHPVADERDDRGLRVTGEIPEALRGTFVRNGPNPAFDPGPRYNLFDGDGMLHAVRLADGAAHYRNRWIETAGLGVERRLGRSVYGGLSDLRPPDPALVGDAGPLKNTANTHIVRHAGRWLCLLEAGPPTEVTPELDTVGLYDFDGKLPGSLSAHPKIDPKTGEMLVFAYSVIPPYLRYFVVDPAGQLVRQVDIDLPAPVMMHDFVVTDRHVVFLDAPAIFDLSRVATGESVLRWEPERGTRFGVMPRDGDGSSIVWHEIDPCYVFHFMNAWSDGQRVCVDAGRLEDFPLKGNDGPQADTENHLTRFEIDLGKGSVSETRLDDIPGGFVQVAPAVAGLENRYGYMSTFSSGLSGTFEFDSVTKHDFHRGTQSRHHYGEGRYTGEMIFAADPDGSAEDDGWLLSIIYDTRDDSSELVILDARAIEAGPVARVHLPRRVPCGFHANWFPD
jgi:carotenoid cleavage dioxygenase-like enzyme